MTPVDVKLMIAIPTLDYIHYEFARCLTGLTRRLDKDGVDFDVFFLGGTLVYLGREQLASEAVNKKYTHVLWLDADMVFEDDLFYKLLDVQSDIGTGVYHSRHAPYTSCMFSKLHPPIKVYAYPEEPFEIEGCGFGCVLTTTEALAAVYRKYQMAFHPSEDFGEDLSFCERAAACGYPIICNPKALCGHIGHLTIWPDNKEVRT